MSAPSSTGYAVLTLLQELFENIYLVSSDGRLFFKTASAQELHIYRSLTAKGSPLCPFLQALVGLYTCRGHVLELVVDLSRCAAVNEGAFDSVLATNKKCRTLNLQGTFFVAFGYICAGSAAAGVPFPFVDLKLGVHTFPLDAPPSKIQSQQEKAMRTTTQEHSIRLMGAVITARSDGSKLVNPAIFTKAWGRACQYSSLLSVVHSFVANKHSLDTLVSRLRDLAEALRLEELYMCGASLLLFKENGAVHVHLIDFAHTYTPEQAARFKISLQYDGTAGNEDILRSVSSASIADYIVRFAHDLVSSYNPAHASPSISSST